MEIYRISGFLFLLCVSSTIKADEMQHHSVDSFGNDFERLKQDIKEELKRELKQDLMGELKEKIKQDLKEEICTDCCSESSVKAHTIDNMNAETYQLTSYACQTQNVSMNCGGNDTINIVKANYGEYSRTCDETCCVPYPFDCVENMADNDAFEWLELKATCDNKTQCDYLFRGASFLEECTVAGDVSYLHVYFMCEPGYPSEAVGFSAYTLEERTYNDGDVVIFDGIVSNFGGYFDLDSSIFVCPYSGIHWFSVSCLSDAGYPCTPSIYVESKLIIKTEGQIDANNGNQASTSTIVECKAGERVWIKNVGDVRVYDTIDRTSSFSGFLLHRY